MTERVVVLAATDDVCSGCKSLVERPDRWGGLIVYCKLTYLTVASDHQACEFKTTEAK